MKLKKCPCGKTPESVSAIGLPQSKWMYVSGDCCGEWNIEFRSEYKHFGKELDTLAVVAWNEAPRG